MAVTDNTSGWIDHLTSAAIIHTTHIARKHICAPTLIAQGNEIPEKLNVLVVLNMNCIVLTNGANNSSGAPPRYKMST